MIHYISIKRTVHVNSSQEGLCMCEIHEKRRTVVATSPSPRSYVIGTKWQSSWPYSDYRTIPLKQEEDNGAYHQESAVGDENFPSETAKPAKLVNLPHTPSLQDRRIGELGREMMRACDRARGGGGVRIFHPLPSRDYAPALFLAPVPQSACSAGYTLPTPRQQEWVHGLEDCLNLNRSLINKPI